MGIILSLDVDEKLTNEESGTDTIEEIESDIIDAEENIENTSDDINVLTEIVNNLSNLRTHVQKFGITKEFLHLVNGNNNLGKALGLQLPYYEEDGLTSDDDINTVIENLPPEEVIMESFGENIKKAKDWVVEKFKQLMDFFSNIWNKFLLVSTILETKLLNLAKEAKESKKITSPEDFEKIKLSAVDANTIEDQFAEMIVSLKTVNLLTLKVTAVSDSNSEIIINIPDNRLEPGLNIAGKTLTFDESKKKYTLENTKEGRLFEIIKDSNAKDLHYNKDFFITCSGMGIMLRESNKTVNKMKDLMEKGKKESIKQFEKNNESKEFFAIVTHNFKVIFEAYNILIKECLYYCKYILMVGNKFNF